MRYSIIASRAPEIIVLFAFMAGAAFAFNKIIDLNVQQLDVVNQNRVTTRENQEQLKANRVVIEEITVRLSRLEALQGNK